MARRNERDWWLLTLARYSGRLASAVGRVLRRMVRAMLAGLGAVDVGLLPLEIGRRLDGRWERQLRTAAGPVLMSAVSVGALDELRRHGPKNVRRIVDAVRQRIGNFISRITAVVPWGRVVDTMRRVAVKIVTTPAIIDPVAKLRRRFSRERVAVRAQRIGDAEIPGAIGGGKDASRSVLFEEGYLNAKRWVTMKDERVRNSHQDTHGQIVGINEFFRVGASLAQYPGDAILPIHEKAGCRCYVRSLRLPPAELARLRERRVFSGAAT